MELDMFNELADERALLLAHPIFTSIHSVADVRVLMEIHVYAVWDFMSLLKRLQIDLTCVHLPWMPPAHKRASRLINEIVVGEESDAIPGNGFSSHLELYLRAMEEIGADTSKFRAFIHCLNAGDDIAHALRRCDVPEIAAAFVNETMRVAQHGTTAEALAYFFFGREDIIPAMFSSLLQKCSVPENTVPLFTYYLKRHIELDGDAHGPAAKQIIADLIHTEEQKADLLVAARKAIAARIRLWNGVYALMRANGRVATTGALAALD